MSKIWQYLLALGFVAAATGALFILRQVLDTTLVALLYLIPLGLITALWGLGPGLTSAIVPANPSVVTPTTV